MTMMCIDGTRIIHEGFHRIRWERRVEWVRADEPGHDQKLPRESMVMSHLWPEMSTQRWIRREIEHGQRTVVILDDHAPIISLPAARMPNLPIGAKILSARHDEVRRVGIEPFTWLGPADRARGEAFLARVTEVVATVPRCSSRLQLVEEDLIGNRQPLRFVYRETAFGLSELRALITNLYESAAPLAPQLLSVEGVGAYQSPSAIKAQKAA